MGTTRALNEAERSRKPNFFIVGAPKCGTSAWFEYLRSHPDIYFPQMKEPCFFAFDLPNFRIVRSEADYARLFSGAGTAKVIGDASAVHLMSEAAAKAIHDYNPAAKILILLRNQEEYLPSLHNQFLWEFAEEIEDFEMAWKLSGRRTPETIPPTCAEPRSLDYAAMGRFDEQVARYLDEFPRDQVMVLHFEDWVTNPKAAYFNILDFLGLPDDGRSEFEVVHEGMTYRSRRAARWLLYPPKIVRKVARLVKRVTGLRPETNLRVMEKITELLSSRGYKRKISPQLREEIRHYYAEDNRHLEERLRGGSISRGRASRSSAA
jgi:hypothetical protein